MLLQYVLQSKSQILGFERCENRFVTENLAAGKGDGFVALRVELTRQYEARRSTQAGSAAALNFVLSPRIA